ncbi:peptidylprolyl isomerase [Bradyrhizobium sp. LHD-71]|uniref:peptidylprolyl isomerase n=1 Tax=Bradyrhizobium sp. LHD-71 TaxID=3072141 RepID=UPI00280E3409|nr:peptidylprolyl isomerase [Bradyrhizobium sp. LHD-71]MDQ8728086.1 peptidylprolyl isomerase [Bradyrhizobium sp. LHD-71]
MNRTQRYRIMPNPRTARPIIGAVLTSVLACSASFAQVQLQQPPVKQPSAKQQAPASAPARPTPPTAAAPAARTTTSGASRANDEIVARVAGRDVSATEVRNFIGALGAREQVAIERDPALLSQAVRLMLANELVLKEAESKKWHEQAAVAARLEQVRDATIVESYLQAVSTPPKTYPEESEVQKAYESNKTAFLVPRQFRISQIFVSLPAGADKDTDEKARKKLADIQSKLKQSKADFAAVAKEASDHRETGERGGELGWVAENQIRPEIKAQVMGLADNAVSEPMKLDDGWHIVKLMETKAAYTRPLTEVRDAIVQQLRAQRADAIRRAYVARKLEESPPAINEIALTKALKQSDASPSR